MRSGGSRDFPQWMWRNSDVLDFVGWLRDYNDSLSNNRAKVGFHGLDLYSLNESIKEVLGYLEKHDPSTAQSFAKRYSCFEHFEGTPDDMGFSPAQGSPTAARRKSLPPSPSFAGKKAPTCNSTAKRRRMIFFKPSRMPPLLPTRRTTTAQCCWAM